MKRFWDKVQSGSSSDCWIWLAATSPRGYGYFYFHGKQQLAHRVSWQLANGDIPDDTHILHKCDNPPCVNPRHLFTGNQAINMHDCKEKGRTNKHGENNGQSRLTEADVFEIVRLYNTQQFLQSELARLFSISKTTIGAILNGETWQHLNVRVNKRHRSSKLTDNKVRAIRKRYAAGGISTTVLAKRYSMSRAGIWKIIVGKSWGHVT